MLRPFGPQGFVLTGWQFCRFPDKKRGACRHPFLLNNDRLSRLNRAGHIFATAHGRLDLAMAIRALGDLHRRSAIQSQAVVDQGRIAFRTGCIHTHSAF
jgi:hypothetical protein